VAIATEPQASAAQAPAGKVSFQYVGSTGLTVIGPVTQKVYVFDGPGMQLSVDIRDARSLAVIPLLRQL
jgi:hypothetical protein